MRLGACLFHITTNFINSDKIIHVEILLIIIKILLTLDGDQIKKSITETISVHVKKDKSSML